MSSFDGFPSDWSSRDLPSLECFWESQTLSSGDLDEETAERLLAGDFSKELPRGFSGIAKVLAAASAPPTQSELAGQDLALAIFRSVKTEFAAPRRSAGAKLMGPRRLAAVMATGVILDAGLVAAGTGSLPGSAQRIASEVLGAVGIDMPGASSHAAAHHGTGHAHANIPPVSTSVTGPHTSESLIGTIPAAGSPDTGVGPEPPLGSGHQSGARHPIPENGAASGGVSGTQGYHGASRAESSHGSAGQVPAHTANSATATGVTSQGSATATGGTSQGRAFGAPQNGNGWNGAGNSRRTPLGDSAKPSSARQGDWLSPQHSSLKRPQRAPSTSDTTSRRR